MARDPSDSPHPLPSEVIEAAAAAWLSLRDRGMSPDETANFLRWLQQDPRHAEIFGELDRTWADFDRLVAVPASPAGARTKPDADLLAPRPKARRRPTLARAALALAAAAAVALGLWTLAPARAGRVIAETEVGAFRKLDLPDGSVVQLNTDSAIETHFDGSERSVRVLRGEVFFAVAKDPTRPFVVSSGPIAVRAIGTAFNVRQHVGSVEVLVTEGRVRIDDTRTRQSALPPPRPAATAPTIADEGPLLAAGERARVPVVTGNLSVKPPAATVERVSSGALQRALAWQERRLEFDSAPLDEVAREFNRYNREQLVIADPALAARHFSGTFRADGYASIVRLLEADFGVKVTHAGREIILRR